MNGNAASLITALTAPKFTLLIKGATHLDAEWPTDLLGQIACGFVNPEQQAAFRRYTTAFLQATLQDNSEAKSVLQSAAKDAALTNVTVPEL